MKHGPRIRIGQIVRVAPGDLKANPRNARTHSKRQIKLIADSVRAFGFLNPILIDETSTVIAGHARLVVAKALDLTEVPAIRIDHLSEDEKRALMLADNQLAARAGWNPEILRIELQHLSELVIDFDVTITGFEMPQIDFILQKGASPTPEDAVSPIDRNQPATTLLGDLWKLGPHRIYCGDAQQMATYHALLRGDLPKVVVADAPYNVKIAGHVSQSERLAHREFAMGVGEMSEVEFIVFLQTVMALAASFTAPGALHF